MRLDHEWDSVHAQVRLHFSVPRPQLARLQPGPGATRQSLAENAVSRFKALVGVKLTARAFENQQVEALVKGRVLNGMAALGLPISERVLQD